MAKLQKRFIGLAALVAVFFLSAAASFAAQGDFTPKTGLRKSGIVGMNGCPDSNAPDCYMSGLTDRVEFNLYRDSGIAASVRNQSSNDYSNYIDERDFTTAAKGVEIAYDEIWTYDNKYQHTLGELNVEDFFYIQIIVDNAANSSPSLGLNAENVLVEVDWSNPRNVIGSINCTTTSVSNPTTDIVTLDLANGSTIKPISEIPILVLTGGGHLPGQYNYLDWGNNAYNNTSQVVNIGTVHPYDSDNLNLVHVYFPFKVISSPHKAGYLPAILSLLRKKRTTSSTINDNVITVDEDGATDIVEYGTSTEGETELRLSGEMANTTGNGSILYMLPGADERFPFGIAGQVTSSTNNTDGTKTVELQEVSYADVVKEASLDIENITLDASNFVGVIAPSAIQAASSMPMAAMSDESSGDLRSFRDGAIIVRGTKEESLLYSLAEADSTTVEAGTVSIDMKVDLVDMGVDASRMSPVDASTSIGFVIKGSLDNIVITNELDFAPLSGGVKSLDLRVDGDLNFDVKFNGNGSVTYGYFSQAWNEVDSESFSMLGVKAKLTGLSSEDKIGKFPLAGLVWSVACPNTCPVLTGKTQTPLRQAKAMGVIVWLYLTTKGEVTLDGDLTLAHLNPAQLSLGVTKSSGNDFKLIRSLERINDSGRLLEAPKISGTYQTEITAGISVDVDFFASGIRIANAGMDLGARQTTTLTGVAGYGTDSLDSSWSWNGELCRSGSIGAGAVFRAVAGFGIAIETAWKDKSIDFNYGFQFPTDEEMDMPGWHGGWYTKLDEEICIVKSSTGRIWMDRNLGASRAATSMSDDQAYGDLYQWGRLTDGHEKRTSSTTETFSSTDVPGHGNFILFGPIYTDEIHRDFFLWYDWRYPANDGLWQGVNGKNNPCPDGFRLPTAAEWEEETATWDTLDAAGAFASPLKLTGAGLRSDLSGGISSLGWGYYWSSSVEGTDALSLVLSYVNHPALVGVRARGYSVRCIRD